MEEGFRPSIADNEEIPYCNSKRLSDAAMFNPSFLTQRSQRLPGLFQINIGLALFKRLYRLRNTCSGISQSALCFMELAQIEIGLTENGFGTDFLCRVYRRVEIPFSLSGGEGDRFD